MRFSSYPAPPTGVAANGVGYTQRIPLGSWLVSDEHGYPLRVHNGFAVFTTKEQADWCVELMQGVYEMGKDAARAEVRAALGLTEPEE